MSSTAPIRTHLVVLQVSFAEVFSAPAQQGCLSVSDALSPKQCEPCTLETFDTLRDAGGPLPPSGNDAPTVAPDSAASAPESAAQLPGSGMPAPVEDSSAPVEVSEVPPPAATTVPAPVPGTPVTEATPEPEQV